MAAKAALDAGMDMEDVPLIEAAPVPARYYNSIPQH
jgi:hypothetical protein